MATIQGSIAHGSGIPLGGLGTGSVEIRPDGYLHEWQVFNVGQWAPRQPEGHSAEGRGILARGAASFDAKLWNGEYYSLWVDGDARDECCTTDQIGGEWLTQLVGLGCCLPKERILVALQAVMRYNFTPEDGLIHANYPAGAEPRLSTYRNLQQMAPWTGIEDAIASMILDFGMVSEGLSVVQSERPAGHDSTISTGASQ